MAQQTPQKGRQISLVCRNHLSRNFCRRYEWPSSRLLCRRIYDLEHKSHSMGLFFFFLGSVLGLWVKSILPKGNVLRVRRIFGAISRRRLH